LKTKVIDGDIPDEIHIEWGKFVISHPLGTIFQSPQYFRIFAKQDAFRPVAVIMLDDTQNVTGVLSGIIQYQLPRPLRHLASRCIVMGGPLVKNDDPDLLKQILDAFDSFICKKTIYTQFRNLFDMNFAKNHFAIRNYQFEDHLNILVDLTRSEEALWKEVHKQKRYEIRRATRDGLIFKPITSYTDLKTSYELLIGIYKRIKLPIFPYTVFENAFAMLRHEGIAAFWGAYLEDNLIGTMYNFCFNGRIYDYFAGSKSIHNDKFPNSLIPWQVMMWGKSNGMSLFDWGGAGKPGVPYGVRDYKEKFGGETVNFGRFEKIHKPTLFRIAKSSFNILKYLKRG